MGKLAFSSHDQTKIAAQVAQMLRDETHSLTPVPFTVHEGNATQGTAAVLDEVRRATLGGTYAANQLFLLHFQMAQPRPTSLDVPIHRTGIGAYAGGLLYATTLRKTLPAQVDFQEGKPAQFVGDSTAAARLNSDAELVRRASQFLRARMAVSGLTASITPFLRLIPQNEGVVFLAYTLPKLIKLGFAATLDSPEFFNLVALIEKNL